MSENGILARFGIGEKFDYGLFIQSILVIIAVILALYSLQWYLFDGGDVEEYIFLILAFVNCFSLLVFSFYEYNKNTHYFFTISIIVSIINIALWFFVDFFYYSSLYGLTIPILVELSIYLIQIVLYIGFLYAFNKKYTSAKYFMLLTVIFEFILEIISCLYLGWYWYEAFPAIFASILIALTYFVRVPKGKYSKIK